MKNVNIVGAGGFSREVKWILQRIGRWNNYTLGVSREYVNENLLSLDQLPTNDPTVIAVGDPRLRRKLFNDLMLLGFNNFPTIIDPAAQVGNVKIGDGSIIAANSILTCDIKLGNFVIVNLATTIGHDCEIGDFVTISPGCHLSGKTCIESGSEIGTGTNTIPGVRIGKDCIIGSGAVVINDIHSCCTAVGTPCKPIKTR